MASTAFLEKAYLAYFGRPVDPVGAYAFKDSTEVEVYEAFYASPESQRLYGTDFGAEQINLIYNMLFGRDAEPAGIDYWTHQLELGLITPAGAALSILQGALNEDKVRVTNKLAASAQFTASLDTLEEAAAYVGDAAAQHAREFLQSVGTLPKSLAQVETSIEQMVEMGEPGVIGKPNLFTLQQVTTVTADVLKDIVPEYKYITYIGFNPHAHGETDVDNLDGNNPDGNDNNLTNEGPFDGGVPLYDLNAKLEPATGSDVVVQKGLFSYIKDLAGLDLINLGVINVGDATGTLLAGLTGAISIGNQTGDNNTATVSVTAADGTVHTAEVDINNAYFKLLTNLIFDEESNLRLYEVEVKVYPTVKVDIDGSGSGDLVDQPVYEYVSEEGSTIVVPLVLTNYNNNGSTVETGLNGSPYVTTTANDLIVAGRLELLHQAYIDAGAGVNTLEVDAKGYYAQPLALTNIQHVKIHNLPNVYTDAPATGSGLPDSTYPDLSGEATGVYKNSVLDLTRAIDIETLTITESHFDGLNGSGQTTPGSLTVSGIRNGAETTIDGSFTQNVYLHYGELQGDGVDLVLNNVNFANSAQLVVAHNSPTLNIESTGGDNYIYNGNLGAANSYASGDGALTTLNISGDAYLFIEGDLNPSFHNATPVAINASANTAGVNLTLSGSQNVTFTGSQGNDRFSVTTAEYDGQPANDETVVINGGVGDNYYEVIGADQVTITNGDGNNNYEITRDGGTSTDLVTITTGNGANHFEIDLVSTAVLTAGNGNNSFDITSVNSYDYLVGDSVGFASDITIVAGNGKNDIDVDADSNIGVVNVTVGNGGNAVNVEAATISVTAGTGADDIRVEGRDITVNAGGSNNTVTVVGFDDDYTDNVAGNTNNAGAPYASSDDGAKLVINAGTNSTVILGSGEDPQEDANDDFPGVGNLVAKEGSSITGTNVKLVVDTIADLRAAELTGVTSVVLDDDASSYAASGMANDVIGSGGLPTVAVSRAVLTLTLEQFMDLGADAFSVDGAVFNTHAYVRVIVDQSTSLTAMGVNELPRNIDLLLDVQDGVTLTMTAEQLHTKVAPQGVTLAHDGNTDFGAGKVVITNGGDDFDPFNTNDTVKTNIGGDVYYGGSLSDDFMAGSNWYNVTVTGGYGGYNRPADAPVEVVWTIDGDQFPSVGAISTWNYNIEITGSDDVVFTGAANFGLKQGANETPFTVDFSQLEGDAIGLTLGNFENVGAVYGNSEAGYNSVVYVELDDSTDKTVGFDASTTQSSTDENVGLVSSGVSKYVVTKIGGPTAPGSTGNTATIVLCDTTQDLEVLALRGNWNDTLQVVDAAWGLVFELQGGSTAKADGPTGFANVGILDATFEWAGADAVVNLVHSVAGDVRPIFAKGITIDNADSITVNAGASSAVIYNIGGDDVSELNFASDADVTIQSTLQLPALSSIDGSDIDGAFTLALGGTAAGAGFDFVASAGTTTLTLDDVSAGTHSSFVATDAAMFNVVVSGATNLSAATLTNVDALSLGTVADLSASSLPNNSVTLSAAQVLDIGLANITLTHPGLNGSLNLVNLGSEAFDAGDLGAGVALGTVTIAAGDVTLNAATVLTDADVTVAAGSTLTLTADQFMALDNLDGVAASATINITGLTQAHIDDGFTLVNVSNATGSVSLAGDVTLASATNLNGFSVTMADGQTLGLATSVQADHLVVNGGADTTVKFLFTTGTGIDVDSYDVTAVLVPAALVAGTNVDAVLVGLPQDVVKTIYNDALPMVDQTVTLQPGVTVAGGMSFNHANTGVELQDFTLNLTGGNVVSGAVNFAVSPKATGLVQTYLDSVTINSTGTAGNIATGKTDNIITGAISPMDSDTTGPLVNNELLNVTINASQNLQIQGGIVFEAQINSDEVATLTVNGTADVSIGSLDTTSDEVDGLNVINNGTGTLTVTIAGGATGFDAADDLSFTGTGDIVLAVSGTVDLSDDNLDAVTELVLANGASVTLTMAQGDAIGAANIVLASGATAASISLEGLSDEPFAVANYGTGVTVNLMTLAAEPSITLNAATSLAGINGLIVPEGTVLNLTAAQFKQLGIANGNAGTITGIKADGVTTTTNFTVNVTGLTQADVAKGFDLGGVSADNLSLTLAGNVAMITPSPLPADWDGFDFNGADVSIGAFSLTLEQVSLAAGLNITGTAGSVLKFTDLAAAAADFIDASGFDVSELHMTTQLVAGQNIDLLFEGLAASVTKVIYDDYGYIVGTNQTVVVDAGSTISGNVAFIKQEGGVEILNFTMDLEGGVQLSGNVNLSAADAGVLIPQHLQTVTINSSGTEGNTLNGETANVIAGNITAAALADVDPVTSGAQPTEENNLLDVTINATQELVIVGDVVFNSVTGDDAVVANDDDEAIGQLTINGTADVSIGGIDTTDTDVDGLNVVNNGTGTLSLTVTDTKVGTDILAFTGTGDIELTSVGANNFSNDNLAAVSAIEVVEGGSLTLSYTQYTALGNANLTVIDSTPGDATIGNASLYINGYTGGAFNATALDSHFNVVEITLADQDVTLDAGVDLTNVTKIWVAEGRTLTLTAAQFQQLKDNGAIDGYDTGDTGTTVGPFNLNITGLTQADVNRDLDAIDDFAEADDGFSLESVNTHGGKITISLGENEVTLAKMVDGAPVTGSVSDLFDDTTGTPVMADFVLAAGQTLGLVNATQASGLNVTGGANSTIVFKYSPHTTYPGQIDASGYDVTTLKALASGFTAGGNHNVEYSIDDLPSTVELRLYNDPTDLGFLDPTFRRVVIEEGITTPTSLNFNDWDNTDEVRTLELTLEGGSILNGDLAIPTRTDKDATYGVQRFFDTLTINSEGTAANTIRGNITTATTAPAPNTFENNLLNIEIDATQALVIGTYTAGVHTSGGDIVFNNNDADAADDVAATLTVTGTADVTMHGINVADATGGGISVLNIGTTSTGTLTLTGGTAAINGGTSTSSLESLVLTGTGDIVMGTDSKGVGAEGIASDTLSLINASGLSGDLTLAEITVDNTNFTLIAGTGKTTLTVESETLNADWDGADNVDGNGDDQAGWVFDLSDAAIGSELHLGSNTYTKGDLAIDLGANATLYIDANTDLTALHSLIVSGVKSIVLADEVTLKLTAAQANGLKIVAGTDTDNDGNRGTVNIVDLMSDTAANNRVYDFGDIAQEVAGTITFATGVNDVTLDALTDLGFFSVTLADIAGDNSSLAGQTIRFATEAQATRDVMVTNTGVAGDSSTNVVWLFNSIAAAGGIDTSGYSEDIGRLWFSEDLLAAEGGLVESLYTTLPSTILRVDFTDLTALNILLNSDAISRTVELVNFANVGNLTFEDVGASPEEHIENLTLKLGGSVKVGNIELDDVVAGPNTDPASVSFDTLTISSYRALHEDDIMAAEAYYNNNDGINGRDTDADTILDTPENAQPANNNTVGNIGVGTSNTAIDLLDVVLNTGSISVVGAGLAGSQGADLTLGTITYDSEVAASTAKLDVNGDNNVTLKSLNTTDAQITALSVDLTGHSGTFTVTGGSPAANLAATETLTIATGSKQDDTITLVASTEDDADESIVVNYVLDGVAGSVKVDSAAVDFTKVDSTKGSLDAAVAAALAAIDGIDATSVAGVVTITEDEGHTFQLASTAVAGDDGGKAATLAATIANGAGDAFFGTKLDTVNGVNYAGVSGSDLSEINVTGKGYVNLGVLASIDGTNDDSTPETVANDGLVEAFVLDGNNDEGGTTVATLGRANNGSVVAPSQAVGSEWVFNDVDLTITGDMKFVTGNTLTLNNVNLTTQGDVDLSVLVDVTSTGTVVEGLFVTGGTINVPAGTSLKLTVDQAITLGAAGLTIVGSGTVKLVGDASNDAGALVGKAIKTVGVDLSLVTIITDDLVAGNDTDDFVELVLTGAVGDDGLATGYNVKGSAFNDYIRTGDLTVDQNDILTGGAGNDILVGLGGSDTYNVDSGTDIIYGLLGEQPNVNPAVEEQDVLVVTGTATAYAIVGDVGAAGPDYGDFYATKDTSVSTTGKAVLIGDQDGGTTIDVSLATGTGDFTIIGGDSYLADAAALTSLADYLPLVTKIEASPGASTTLGEDFLIGGAGDDTINGGNNEQIEAAKDVLTGNAGRDTFKFNVAISTPAVLTEGKTVAGNDSELLSFTPDGADDANETMTITYKVNNQVNAIVVSLGAIDSTDGDAIAAAVNTAITTNIAGVTSEVVVGAGADDDEVLVTASNGGAFEILSIGVAGTVTGLAGVDSETAVAADDDEEQSTVLTVSGSAAAVGEVYSLSVTLRDGTEIIADDYVATTGSETALQIATGLVANFNAKSLVIGSPVVASAPVLVGSSYEITLTGAVSSDADDGADGPGDAGGFTVSEFTASGALSGTGASRLLLGSIDDLNSADIITDFSAVDDSLSFEGLAAGTGGASGNFDAGTVAVLPGTPDVEDYYNAALADADAALGGNVIYYLTSIQADLRGTGLETTGLLFIDANSDGDADAVVALVGITTTNFSFQDIVAG